MKTRRRLSMNSQLIELRSVCNIIKNILPDAVAIDSYKGTSLQSSLKEVVYSLRDAQYKIRGQKEVIRRSSQLRSMKLPEIYDFVNDLVGKVPSHPQSLPSDLSPEEAAFRNSAMKCVAALRQISVKLESSVEYYALFMAPQEGEDDRSYIDVAVASVEDAFSLYDKPITLESIDAIRDALVQKHVSL